MAILEQRLGIDDHLSPIVQDILVIHCVNLGIVERRIDVVDVRHCCWMQERDVVNKLGVGMVERWRRRDSRVELCPFLVQVFAQSNHTLPRENAKDRSLVVSELCGCITAKHLKVFSQECLHASKTQVG